MLPPPPNPHSLSPYQRSILVAIWRGNHDINHIRTFLQEVGWIKTSLDENTIEDALIDLEDLGYIDDKNRVTTPFSLC